MSPASPLSGLLPGQAFSAASSSQLVSFLSVCVMVPGTCDETRSTNDLWRRHTPGQRIAIASAELGSVLGCTSPDRRGWSAGARGRGAGCRG